MAQSLLLLLLLQICKTSAARRSNLQLSQDLQLQLLLNRHAASCCCQLIAQSAREQVLDRLNLLPRQLLPCYLLLLLLLSVHIAGPCPTRQPEPQLLCAPLRPL
jgi:hypothetical protein